MDSNGMRTRFPTGLSSLPRRRAPVGDSVRYVSLPLALTIGLIFGLLFAHPFPGESKRLTRLRRAAMTWCS